jgi:RNA polymerase sigma-70 factor, ECF subfamily
LAGATALAAGASDQTLAEAAAVGSRDAFAELIARHYDRIYRLAWRWCGNRAEAEDIAQDVVVKLATAIRGFRGEAAFSTWVYRIAYTTTTDRIRARQRIVPFAPSQMQMLIDQAEQPVAPDASDGAELWAAVRALPDQQRDAVLLVYGEDLSHQAAAQILGCSEKTVSWHLYEARKRLKIKLTAVG